MAVRTKELAHQRASELDALIDGMILLDRNGFGIDSDEKCVALYYHPIALGNPFQALYYSKALENGILPIGLNNLSNIEGFRSIIPSVVHLHWLGEVIGDAENSKVAQKRVDEFIIKIDALKSNGFKIVWTVHNILPHDSILQNEQTRLRMELIKRCDVIHTMCEQTVELAKSFYSIPKEKIICVPHPSYEDYYPIHSEKLDARYQLGIDGDEFVFLFFGSIQAYKGLHGLIRAFKGLKSKTNRKIRLLIAGKVHNPSNFKTIKDEITSSPDISLIQNRISTEDVQYFFKASDVCVCPYRITLNSGVAHLAHTFKIPVIGPNVGGFKELLDDGGGLLFKQLDGEDLLQKMLESMSLNSEVIVKEISESNKKHHPNIISERFSKLLKKSLEDLGGE